MVNTVPRVAVSILNYNSAQSTIACVQSLLSAEQASSGAYRLEIFVADNASGGDEPVQLRQAFSDLPNVNFHSNSENLGFAAGHNGRLQAMFSHSNPDYIWLLNNDCLVDAETLPMLLKCAQQNPRVGIWGATLLEADSQTIQCAGGCKYNTWISDFRQHGHGKKLSRLDQLKPITFDYISGASLFFPLASLQNGFRKTVGVTAEHRLDDAQWLNESFFLYFEELDLAMRLKPGLELGWARDALIVHVGGVSAGTSNKQRTAQAEYHSTLSALKFTSFYYPGRLWFMAPARFLSKSLLLLFTGYYRLLGPLSQAYRDFRLWQIEIRRSTDLKPQPAITSSPKDLGPKPSLEEPLVTIAVPSLNQGRFLNDTLASIFEQDLPVEVFVMDGGSSDNSLEIISQWEPKLAGWRSHPDAGQAAAINEGIARGSAPYVCWLNSDDFFYPNGLKKLLHTLQKQPDRKFVYGRCWTVSEAGTKLVPYLTLPFIPRLFANFCFIAQPATLVTRQSWEGVAGLDEDMHLAFDFNLWWQLFAKQYKPVYCRKFVAATRMHKDTKTTSNIELHYEESIKVVKRNWGSVPYKWRAALPVIKVLRKIVKHQLK